MRARATCETIAPTSAKHLSHCVSQASPCVPRKARGREETPAVNQLPNKSCAELHLAHIAGGGDPFELGNARPLDFGHWAAHKLEQSHGV